MGDVSSLGQYKVVVTADYSVLRTEFKAMTEYVTRKTKQMTNEINASMNGLNTVMLSQLQTTVNELKKAFDGLGDTTRRSGDGFKSYAQQIKEAQREAEKAHQQIQRIKADMAEGINPRTSNTTALEIMQNEFDKARLKVDRLKAAQEDFKNRVDQTALSAKQMDKNLVQAGKDEQNLMKQNARMLEGNIKARNTQYSQQAQQISRLQTQYRVAYEEINKYLQSHAKMSEAVFIRLQGRITAIGNELRRLGATPVMANPLEGMDYEKYASGFSKLRDVIESTKHHITWMISAAVIGLTVSIPHAVSSAIESFEALQTKIMQNMELAKQYENNPQKLHGDMEKMGQAAKTFAQGYGMSIQEVQEGMQIITRRFKDAGTAIYLTNIALQMSKLDMVDVKQSAKDLEAVMLQFNMGAKDANKFLNDFSVICHVARISGTDMLMALERSGSAFKAMNMDARAAMAAIAAVSTVTGKSGATIGDSWKSILANMDFKKATQALEAYNIKLYDVQQNGTKTMRNGTAVLADILRQFKELDDEGRRKLATAIAGGKYQVNNMMAFLADASGSFNSFLDQMNEKSSDAMTAKLLEASMNNYQTNLGQAKAAFENFAITIGELLLPALKNMALLMTGVGIYLQEHANDILNVVGALGKLLLAYLAFTGISSIFQTLKTVIKELTIAEAIHSAIMAIKNGLFAIGVPLVMAYNAFVAETGVVAGLAAAGQVLLNSAVAAFEVLIAPLSLTVLAVVAAISALAVIAYEVYENWETVSNDLAYIWNFLVDVISSAIEYIILAISPFLITMYLLAQVVEFIIKDVIAPIFRTLGEVVGKVITAINNWLKEHGITTQNIANNIRFIWNNFIAWLANNISPAFAQWLSDMVEKLLAFAKKVWEIASSVRNAIRSMFGMAQSAGENGGGFIDNIAKSIKQKLSFDLLNTIADAKAKMEQSEFANEHSLPTGTMPNGISGGGSGSKGKGGKGAKGAKEADNSIEAMLYRFLTKDKKLSHNRAIGELANIQAISGFNYNAGEGTDKRGLYGWNQKQWAEYEKWLAGTGYKDSAVSQINYKHTYAEKYDKEEKAKYREYLQAGSSTPQEFAQAYSDSITKIGNIDKSIVDALDKRFAKKNGEENYSDPMKDMLERYKDLKKEFDKEIESLKTERAKTGDKVTAEEQLKLFEKIMGIGNNKNPFAYLEQAQKDYEKQLLEAAKYEAKRQEDIRKSTETHLKALEKMADGEIAFAEKLGLINKADVRKYNYEKNESNYARQKPILDAKLGATVDLQKATADEMLAVYQQLIYAQSELEARHYAEKLFYLSRDVDATQKALNEEFKLEETYQNKRRELNEEAFLHKSRYALTFIDSLTKGIEEGLEGILNRTKSFAEAFRDIFKGIVQDIIKLFSKDFAERIKKWISNAIFKPKETGNKAGSFIDPDNIFGGKKGKDNFDLGNGLSLMGSGMKKANNPILQAMGLTPSLASQAKAMITPVTYTLRNSMQNTIAGMTNISQQGMYTISSGIQSSTQAMGATWTTFKDTQVTVDQMGNMAIVGQTQATAATVQATTATMMTWLMAVLALFSLFGGGGGGGSSTSTSSQNLGRAPESYYMTPTPVLQSTTYQVPSMDIGGNIERDMFAYVHKNEMVLTPEQADVIRNTAKNGGTIGNGHSLNGGATVNSNVTVSTVDSKGFDRVLKDYQRQLSRNVKKGIRNGYLNPKGLM